MTNEEKEKAAADAAAKAAADKAAEEAKAAAEAAPLTETISGGRYLDSDGKTYRNANGERITKAGKVIED